MCWFKRRVLLCALLIAAGVALHTATAQAIDRGRYRGKATIEMCTLNLFSGDCTGTRTIKSSVRILIRDPLRAKRPRQKEGNPFNFLIVPEQASVPADIGDIYLNSAAIAKFSDGSQLLLKYWDIEEKGRRFRASLNDNHSREAANSEMIYAPFSGIIGSMTMPYSLYDGRYGDFYQNTMAGRSSGRRLKLRIRGCGTAAGQGIACFDTRIDAKRRS